MAEAYWPLSRDQLAADSGLKHLEICTINEPRTLGTLARVAH